MDEDWEETATNQKVVIWPKIKDNINKWDGEDEEEDVKDSWEDEEKKDEEKIEVKPAAAIPVKTKPNKLLKAKLEEQARLEAEEEEKKLAMMTPEEKLAEKLKLQQIQEESDLKSALETFGVPSIAGSLDAFDPDSKEEFKEFGASLSLKISQYKQSPHFPQFVEDLIRSICVNLSASDMKKCKISIENLHSEKLKLEKQNAKKPSGKGKTKASLRKDTTSISDLQYTNDYDDDFDDFM